MQQWFIFIFLIISPFQKGTLEECNDLIREGVIAMYNREHTHSLELLTKAQSIAKENNWHEQIFLSTNNIGANYYYMLDYGEALDHYLEAYTIAIRNLDEDHEMIVLNNIAILYSKEKDFDKAEEYFQKAYQIATKKREQVKIGMYAVNLGIVANKTNQLNKAKDYIKEALPLLQNNPDVLLQAKIALAENNLLLKNYERADDIAREILTQLEEKPSDENQIATLLILSKIHAEQNNYPEAIDYTVEALQTNSNPDIKVDLYAHLAKLYTDTGQLDLALQAKDSIIQLNTELSRIKNSRVFEANKVKFEIQNYQKELQINQEKLKAERKIFYGLIGFAVLIIALIAWALRNSFIKNKQRKIIHKRTEEILALELEKKESDNLLLEKQLKEKEVRTLLEQEKLKNEIESKNRKLAAKALHQSNKNELIEHIINTLSTQTEVSKNAHLKAQIQQLKNHLKNDGEWDDFLTHFEEVNHGFITSLKEKHPTLNANDIRFISYMYMNLSIKEIALLLNITPEACRKRKERISKKMGIPDDTDLYFYLSGI